MIRRLLHQPAFSLTVIVVLALGIGANSAVFSVIDAVLLKPLPYPEPDRLVSVYEFQVSGKQGEQMLSPVHLDDWARLNRSFDGLAGCYFENLTDTSGSVPERINGMRVSPNFFPTLKTPPALGHWLAPESSKVGGPLAAVISDAYWQRRFHGDPNVLGQALRLGGANYPVVGVMPPAFRYPSASTDVWTPAQFGPPMMRVRNARFYKTIGRLRAGVTPEQAQSDLDVVQRHLGEKFPETDLGWASHVNPLKEEQVGGVRQSLWLLFGAVGLLLLIACGNVACLMLAQASDRQREIAIRFALGASRRTVVRQLFNEGVALALCGGLAGLAIAYQGVGLLRHAAVKLPRLSEIQVDWRIVAFTFLACIASTLLFALAPAWMAAGNDRSAELAQGGYWQAGSRQRLPRALVSFQIALAIVLLVGAGLLIRSFARLSTQPLGFNSGHILSFRVTAGWGEDAGKVAQRQLRTLQNTAALPGVESSAMATALPATVAFTPSEFQIVGRETSADSQKNWAIERGVSSGFFRTVGIPLTSGETCRMSTDPEAPQEVLVNRRFAELYFPRESPIGHSILPLVRRRASMRIIGVVADAREDGAETAPQPTMYYCGTLFFFPDPTYMIRTSGDPALLTNAVREVVRKIDPSRALYAVRPMSEALADSLAPQRFNTLLLGLFAATALLLASVGLYGVMSYFVARRRREIGIRMAIGAQPRQILRGVIRQAAVLTAAGVAGGLIGAAALTRFVATMLYGVREHDALTFALAPLLLIVVALLAATLPALQASRVNPMVALRNE